jgi:hypothetical protein
MLLRDFMRLTSESSISIFVINYAAGCAFVLVSSNHPEHPLPTRLQIVGDTLDRTPAFPLQSYKHRMVSPLRGETAPLCIRGGSAADTAADDGNGNGNGHDNGGELAPSAVPRLAVTFLRSESLGDGEALYISGDCDALGNLDPARAVPMKRAGGKRWTVEVRSQHAAS